MGYNSKVLIVKLPKNTVTNLKKALGSKAPSFPHEIESFYGIIWDILSQLNDADYNGMVPLNWDVLRQKYSTDKLKYNEYLDYLIDNNIIVSDGHYIPKVKSKHYKLVAPLIANEVETVYLSLKSTLGKKIIKKRKSEMDTIDNLKAKNKVFLKQMRDNIRSTQIDSVEALKFINTQFDLGKLNKERKYYADIFVSKLDKDNRGNLLLFRRSEDNFRIYDGLTNTPHYLKQFIISDEPLIQFDLSNSQPLIANILFEYIYHSLFNTNHHLNNKYYDNLLLLFRKDNEIKEALSLINKGVKTSNSYRSKLRKEIDKYRNITSSGKWYEYLSDLYNKGYDTDYFNRDIAKGLHMVISYSKVRAYPNDKKIFKAEFPLLHQLINLTKKGKKVVENKEESNHSLYAIILQKIESILFIDGIAKELIEGHNIVPYTQHDSITVKASHKAIAMTTINNVLEGALGFKPPIKEEYWKDITVVKDKLKKDKREYKNRIDEYNKGTENIILENELTAPDIPQLNLITILEDFISLDRSHFIKAIGGSKTIYDNLIQLAKQDELKLISDELLEYSFTLELKSEFEQYYFSAQGIGT